jgi:pyridoxal phosphate enzyme (YggS family)
VFSERLKKIQEKIDKALERSGRNQNVQVVAVSKLFPHEVLKDAYDQGQRVFGENRIQEAVKKAELYKDLTDMQIQFIGHIQTNKVRYLKDNFTLIHSVDSEKLASEMQKHFEKQERLQDVLVQVNIAGDENKSGTDEQGVYDLCQYVTEQPNLNLKGLMMMPPLVENAEDNRKHFADMKELFDKMNVEKGYNMEILSMGMSGDFEIAVEEGSNMVRIGTALFGQRNYNK